MLLHISRFTETCSRPSKILMYWVIDLIFAQKCVHFCGLLSRAIGFWQFFVQNMLKSVLSCGEPSVHMWSNIQNDIWVDFCGVIHVSMCNQGATCEPYDISMRDKDGASWKDSWMPGGALWYHTLNQCRSLIKAPNKPRVVPYDALPENVFASTESGIYGALW